MKLETAIIITKGLCYLTVGIFTPWTVALAQWVNSGEWPQKIIWFGVILPASAISGANSLLAFLSGSYKSYMEGRSSNGNGNGTTQPTAVKP